ncbi:MAG: UpxY family transcription antiterminator [Planctomycetota bacterium]|nr:UpxY family transcription antiterminator [Planctomycetota bacterium]
MNLARSQSDEMLHPEPTSDAGVERPGLALPGEAHQRWLVEADSGGTEWYAAYVRSRHEKLVAQQWSSLGIRHFLPLVEREKRWSDRKVRIDEPLFPGYLFVNVPRQEHAGPVRVRGLVGLVSSAGGPCAIPVDQLRAIDAALRSGLRCDPYPSLHEGMDVEVVRGPLKGCRGILLEKKKKHVLLLSVELIGQSVAVEIAAPDVRPS